jgi:hypothetical protein
MPQDFKHKRAFWLCLCDCGNKKVIEGAKLTRPGKPTRSCGCLYWRRADLSGMRFGKLLVKKHCEITAEDSRTRYICECECGRVVEVIACNIRRGNSTSCGCVRIQPCREAGINWVYSHYKKSAKQRGIHFDLTKKHLESLIEQDCSYCGLAPSNTVTLRRVTVADAVFHYNGIDRLDNDSGYVSGNVVPCCRECNFAKGSRNAVEFKDWIARIVYHNGFRKYGPLL